MDKFFAYCPETGFETFETKEEAQEHAEACLEDFRERAEEGWDEAVRNVCWGELKQTAQLTTIMTAEAAERLNIGCACDEFWDFSLECVEDRKDLKGE